MTSCKMIWGFLRETSEKAEKAGIDTATGLHRTGLDEYLKVIFPNISDWQHDKTTGIKIDGKSCKKRPDYRSEKLKLVRYPRQSRGLAVVSRSKRLEFTA